MRFESIEAVRYGCLVDRVASDRPLPEIVVVLGPNESGKSTFFDLACTLLHGFRPASRDLHPYTPWSGGDPEGRASIRLDTGELHEVRRRLRSVPEGTVTSGGRARRVRNRPLPWAKHVSRSVYRQVYALTLNQLASLEAESWDLVQDRLVGGLGAPDLRSARAVAGALEDEANRLWRPDRRGRPEARALSADVRGARAERRAALKRESELRERLAEKTRAEEELEALRARRRVERERRDELARLSRLEPVRRSLARIEELERFAGPRDELEPLAPDPERRRRELAERRRELEGAIADLDALVERSRRAIDDYAPETRAVAEAEERVRAAAASLRQLDDLKGRAATAEGVVTHLEAECERAAKDLFSAPWDEVDPGALASAAESDLDDALRRLGARRERCRVAERSLGEAERDGLSETLRPGPARAVVGAVLLPLGAALALVGTWDLGLALPLSDLAARRAGALAMVGGAGALLLWWDARRRAALYDRSARAARARRRRSLEELEDECDALAARVRERLSGLPVREELLADPDLELLSTIRRANDLALRLGERREVVDERCAELASAHEEVEWLLQAVPACAAVGDRRSAAEEATRALDRALARRDAATVAGREIERAKGERARRASDLDRCLEEARDLEERLSRLGDGDAERGAATAAARIEAGRRARRMADELERSESDLEAMARAVRDAEANGETWEGIEARIEAAEAERRDRVRRSEALVDRLGRLETDVERLREGDTLARVEGRLAALEERVRDAKERRDRAFVLARLLREADRRFRDEHQSDLLARASGHLDRITLGRYDRIEAGDGGHGSLRLSGPAVAESVDVGGPLSQGTREQVYLALRLAIVDHLDAEGERLPLFMDEVLVNWDAWRRDRAFELLERIARRRQVFLFTCHPAMAAEMEDRGAAVVALRPA